MSDDEVVSKTPQARSPKYPYIALDLAIERVKKIYEEIREHAQPREVVAKAYGKPIKSSATLQTFATLIQYGLLENVLVNGDRRLRVSQLAQTILHPHAPQDKVAAATQEAAMAPPIFRELWEKFGDTSGLNESMPLYYLTVDRATEHDSVFTEKAAADVLRVYQATIDYANIGQPDKTPLDDSPSTEDSSGVEDQGGGKVLGAPPPPQVGKTQMAEGERELQSGMLSKGGATYRVIVSGQIGQKEIERLIAKLELDKEMLADDDGGVSH